MSKHERKKVGIPTLKRLPLYLRLLRQMKEDGHTYASGAVVAKKLNLDPIVVRKDLAITGAVGKPRLGFSMDEIIEAIEDFLGWTNTSEAFLVGVGNLGRALLRHKGFEQHGLKIIAGFDSNTSIIGDVIAGKKIYNIDDLVSKSKSRHIQIGILTVSPTHAQSVADLMVEAGIRAIWNFTPVTLKVPDYVILQREELASSLAVLSHRLLVDKD